MGTSTLYRSRISEGKIRQIVKLFGVDLDTSQIVAIVDLNRNTINKYLVSFRERIAQYCETESPVSGEVEVDKSYFGARRGRGVRSRGARDKTACLNETGAFTLKSSLIVPRLHFKE